MSTPAFFKTGSGAVFIVDGAVVAAVQRPADYDPKFAWTASAKKRWFIVDDRTGEATFATSTLAKAEAICREQYAA